MKKIFGTVLALLMSLALGVEARADSQPRTHDGGHIQITGGFGYYSTGGDSPQAFSGTTVPTSFFFGGTIGKLAVGGGLLLDYAPSPTYEFNDVEQPDVISSQFILGLGPYADYYFNPRDGGWHVQAFLGWGGLETSFNGNVGGSDPTGLVTHVGVGYDWWVSDEWSAGMLGRILYAPVSLNGVSYTTVEPAVLASLTWH